MNRFVPFLLTLFCVGTPGAPIPDTFVSVAELDPSIEVEGRYFSAHNFIGRTIHGYHSGKCLLTRPAATALAAVQADLRVKKLSLKTYDCYRPQRAVNDFIEWAKDLNDQKMKAEFYPRVNKAEVFKRGYVASKSGHSRGSTLDLTLVPLPTPKPAVFREGQPLIDCTAERGQRFFDNMVEMGTGYDCFDGKSATADKTIPEAAQKNRTILRAAMEKHGFKNYEAEWWHYTLKDEPYPETYFDFEIP